MGDPQRIRGRFTSASGAEAGRRSRSGGRPTNAYRRELEQIRLRALRRLLALAERGVSSDATTEIRALEIVVRGSAPRSAPPDTKPVPEKAERSATGADGSEQR